jgi:thiol-disulfide isomerase/thioredoxin
MQKTGLVILIALLSISLQVKSQEIKKIGVAELEQLLASPENRLSVINFWATWCPPCVRELPHFEKVAREYDSSNVSFILISLDFPGEVQKKLIAFIRKNNLTIPVWSMSETDANLWIEKVDKQWQGNIPATLFINNAKKIRRFNAGELDETELRKTINQLL